MPLYEYTCRKCSHVFEELVRVGETPACPKCKSQDLERLMSQVGGRVGEDAASRAQLANQFGRSRGPRSDR
jgi:putative FmdB family regulatory protein